MVKEKFDEAEDGLSEDEIEEVELALREIREKGIKRTTYKIEDVAKEFGIW